MAKADREREKDVEEMRQHRSVGIKPSWVHVGPIIVRRRNFMGVVVGDRDGEGRPREVTVFLVAEDYGMHMRTLKGVETCTELVGGVKELIKKGDL